MKHSWLPLFFLLLIFVPTARSQVREDPLVDQVKKSIDRGVQYLRDVERGQGHWEVNKESTGNPGGWTSLALLALLNSGVPVEDPIVKRGLEYLRKIPPSQTYVVGLQTMVFALAGQGVDQARIQRNVEWILAARLENGWSYNAVARATPTDNSNTQYALLGLHEGLMAGAKVPRKDLQEIRDFYIRTQKAAGWGYRINDERQLMTMTTAGLCGLVITGMDLALGQQALNADGSAENCGIYRENKPVADALQWLGSRFPGQITDANVHTLYSTFYGLYGIERAGRLTGRRFLGQHDWYRVGCEYLVRIQERDGSWVGRQGQARFDYWPVVSTSFSLLFLSKGRTPVLLTKLAHNNGDDWNNKRNDMRHVVEFASRELFKKQPLAWQVFDMRDKPAENEESRRNLAAELLQSPLVWVSGHDLAPRDKEEAVLGEYLGNGGFLFAEACCGQQRFDRDFRALMKRMFPDSELKPLPPEHPVWNAWKPVEDLRECRLEGIQQGCKTIVIYSPQPLAGHWEANDFTKGRGARAFRLAGNVIAYATGLEPPKPRLTEVEVFQGAGKREEIKRGYLKVAQLRHEGDWQPAPKAMANLMQGARKLGLDVVLETKPLHPAAEEIADYRFLYMHGRNQFSFRAADVKNLRFNLETGGLLLADACCGSKSFDASFRKFMEELWSDKKLKLEPIPLTDELFSKDLNGETIGRVKCRRETPDSAKPDPIFRDVPPALEGIRYNNRWVVIYSRYDIGCALEKHQSSDCLGHDHGSALKLGQAAILYSLRR